MFNRVSKLVAETTELTITLAVVVGSICSAEAGAFSGKTAATFSTVAAAAYALSRGLSKHGTGR